MELLVRLILCRDGLFIAGIWPSVVNLKLGNTFLVPSEWCMTELVLGTSAKCSIGEKSRVGRFRARSSIRRGTTNSVVYHPEPPFKSLILRRFRARWYCGTRGTASSMYRDNAHSLHLQPGWPTCACRPGESRRLFRAVLPSGNHLESRAVRERHDSATMRLPVA